MLQNFSLEFSLKGSPKGIPGRNFACRDIEVTGITPSRTPKSRTN